jgi:hypothetical protein
VTSVDQKQIGTAVFFPVSIRKLAIMSLVSFGLYELWWLFKNWKYIQESSGRKIMPAARAFFGVIWVYPLLKEMRKSGQERGVMRRLDAGMIAIAWIILSGLWRLPDPWWLISLISFVPLLAVQGYINELNKALDPACDINDKFTKGNWAFIILGGLVIVLDVAGQFLPK